MLSNASSSENSSLSKTLQKTLQGVLMDLSIDDSLLLTPCAQQSSFNVTHQRNTGHPMVSHLNLLPSSDTKVPFGLLTPSAAIAERSSVALGLTSEGLLRVALERRMIDQKVAAAVRQQLLADERSKRHRLTECSLYSLIQGGSQQSLGHGSVKQPFLSHIAQEKNTAQKNAKENLLELGNSLKKKDAPYIDISTLTDPNSNDSFVKKTRGGVTEPFPEKLHRMLREVEEDGKVDIVSFFPHGRAFAVHDSDRFVSEIMPKYFKHGKVSSFQLQLNLYGFTRINSGPDVGGYYHELFLKGRPALCILMRRVGIKGGNRKGEREMNASLQPDFYSMPAVSAHRAQSAFMP